MENNDVLDLGLSANSPKLSTADKGHLKTAAGWAKFLAIVYFIFEGFLALVPLLIILFGSTIGGLARGAYGAGLGAGVGIGLSFYLLITILLLFFPTLYLYRFAIRTQDALRTSDDDYLTEAFSNLKSMFKFMGILMIIFLSFYALIFVFGIVGLAVSR